MQDIDSAEHGLYRAYDAARRLLYVGISVDPEARLRTHRSTAVWWPEHASHTVAWYFTRRQALAAELKTIWMEHPVYNRTGSVCDCGGACGVCANAAGELGGYGPLRPPAPKHECPSVLFSMGGQLWAKPLRELDDGDELTEGALLLAT